MDERRIDRVVIDKSARTLWAYEDGRPVRTFLVALGREPIGQKERQGDGRTPEAIYPVVAHKPDSDFHRALRLGYPTREPARAAEEIDWLYRFVADGTPVEIRA